jgi:hypothetical protein
VGVALLYGDGAITPAISLLSAVEGLKVDAPGSLRIHAQCRTICRISSAYPQLRSWKWGSKLKFEVRQLFRQHAAYRRIVATIVEV